MQIPLLILGLGLFLSPLWTGILFHIIRNLERYQIDLDNEGIKLGRSDIGVLKGLQKSNKLIEWAELQHHIYHACARNPVTAPTCVAKDALAEKIILGMHREAFFIASKTWRTNGILFTNQDGGVVCDVDRLYEIPIVPQTCDLCGLEVFWEVDHSKLPVKTDLRSCLESSMPIEARVRLWGNSLRSGEWSYSLHPDRRGDIK